MFRHYDDTTGSEARICTCQLKLAHTTPTSVLLTTLFLAAFAFLLRFLSFLFFFC
eukprot:m.90751 g.90751  ORF g.90751 m.90751 type:complete len:55 (+) comp12925_c1_seq1:23-187(+)